MHARAGFWLAVRAYGVDQAVAHSAPVYITIDGGGFENTARVAELARKMMAKLGEFETMEADATQELEAWSVGANLTTMLDDQRLQILDRAADARAVYARMLDQP